MISKKKKNTNLILIICTVLYLICYAAIVTTNKMTGYIVSFGPMETEISNLSGIITTIQMLICVGMTLVNHNKGGRLALFLMAFSIVSMIMHIISENDPLALPGITMMLVCAVTVSIIKRQLLMREEEAFTDYLTGLLNRRGLISHLERVSKNSKPFHMLYLDVDEFKFINDTYGHKAGDRILKIIAERIKPVLDKKSIFGRIGGDEFIIIIPECSSISDTAEEILRLVKQEVYLEENNASCYISASIGITSFPADSHDSAELIKFADIAMYYAKKNGKNRIQIFDKSLADIITRESELEALIRESLSKENFYLVYQPQFESSSKKLRGFETLLRINSENYDSSITSELITIAEKTDIIFEIDDYVLEKALSQFCDTVNKCGRSFTLSVNVSARNISRKKFIPKIEYMLEKTGFPAQCLEIEITEYCLVQSIETTVNNIQRLKDLGIKIALDDFGTGYASLSYLSKLPVDLLKIDKSFVDDIENNSVSSDFINAVISLGHLLGCEVISEGVENSQQLDMLKQRNCDFIQGFVWGRPLEFDEAVNLCRENFK